MLWITYSCHSDYTFHPLHVCMVKNNKIRSFLNLSSLGILMEWVSMDINTTRCHCKQTIFSHADLFSWISTSPGRCGEKSVWQPWCHPIPFLCSQRLLTVKFTSFLEPFRKSSKPFSFKEKEQHRDFKIITIFLITWEWQAQSVGLVFLKEDLAVNLCLIRGLEEQTD